VKDNGRACLADFGFMSIALDPGTTSVTLSAGEKAKGTYPWMSPELFDPTIFDLPKCRLTKESDCYALGMVIYEVCGLMYGYSLLPQSYRCNIGPLRKDTLRRDQKMGCAD
jgi:serine/threonine protein kinase